VISIERYIAFVRFGMCAFFSFVWMWKERSISNLKRVKTTYKARGPNEQKMPYNDAF